MGALRASDFGPRDVGGHHDVGFDSGIGRRSMTGGVVGGYAVGWAIFASAFLLAGMRSRPRGARVFVPIALLGATVWPVFVAGVAQWAVIAATIEVARAIARRVVLSREPSFRAPRVGSHLEVVADGRARNSVDA